MKRQVAFVVFAIIIFGVLVPYLKGFEFFDAQMILGYACVGMLFSAPAAAVAFSGKPDSSKTLRLLLSATAYGWGVSMILLGAGILTVNLANWHSSVFGPPPRLLIAAVLLGGAASLAIVAVSSAITALASARAATSVLRFFFLILILAVALSTRRLNWQNTLSTAGLTRASLVTAAGLAAIGIALDAWLILRRRTTANTRP
jgi:hypothetical protein